MSRAEAAPPVLPRIGFAVRDAGGPGAAFEIDARAGRAGEALVFGSRSAIMVSAPGVLPAHFVVLPYEGGVAIASADARRPALLNGAPLPTSWTTLEIPSRIRAGAAAVDFFYVRESLVMPVDVDIDATQVRSSGRRDPAFASASASASASVSASALASASSLLARVRDEWRGATPAARVVLGLFVFMLVFILIHEP